MNKREVFNLWAPPDSIWSQWVKPVLFAHLDRVVLGELGPLDAPDVSWAPPADGQTALVIDVPGAASVHLGLVLADAGYRPVPLFNAAPGPTDRTFAAASYGTPAFALVDVAAIVQALAHATENLRALSLAPNAPPAFLLDADRRMGRVLPAAGLFDNRSITFATDFPSANFLLAQGIRRAMVIQVSGREPQEDLAHTLRRWQEGGIPIHLKALEVAGPAMPIAVRKPFAFRLLWQRLLARAGLRRNPLGGFGGILPDPSSG